MKENKTALYLRLSRDDGGKVIESESIANQRDFLIKYAEENNFNVVEILSDDGYSGTSFKRPGFSKLIELIEQKAIDTIITKDLSRLGRDYIQTGYYVEQFFPLHGIRYIAVNDLVDTMNKNYEDDMTPFRAVFNDMYAKDISKKVRTALNTKKLQGKFIGSQAPYGFRKDPYDKNHLIIDENAAVYVRQIFNKFISGESLSQIASFLTQNNVPTPSDYKKQMKDVVKASGVWNTTIIKNILTNPTYIGNITQNRSKKISYKVDKRVKLDPKDWIVVENTHNPIISERDFKIASELLLKRNYHKKARSGKEHLLSGVIFCGDCKSKMSFIRESPTRTYLVCSKWRKNTKTGGCSSHSIREDTVEGLVKEKLKETVINIDKNEVLLNVEQLLNERNDETDNINILKKKIQNCKTVLWKLYTDKYSALITEDEYVDFSKNIRNEMELYETQMKLLFEQTKGRVDAQILKETLARLLDFDKIDRNILLMLVDSVYINASKEIEIRLKFNDVI